MGTLTFHPPFSEKSYTMSSSTQSIRNVAIVAHVDHGKTTLVDSMFRHAGTFRSHQQVVERALDSEDQERERGITILAKNTSMVYRDVRINVVDTPGHADFGGQVERTLSMADGVLLLVDAFEGPMPQTRFVLRKAFEHGLKALVMINKIDRQDCRPEEVLDEVFDLFVELGATGDQLDFPVVYGSGRDGYAGDEPGDGSKDLEPLFRMLLDHIPPPEINLENPLRFQAVTLDHDDFLGRIAVGRVTEGVLKLGSRLFLCHPLRDRSFPVTVKSLFRYEGLVRTPTNEVSCGDIAVVGGIEEFQIGDTLCPEDHQNPLPAIKIDEPTISMIFRVNDSPLSGKDGKYVTSRHLLERLRRASTRDVALTLDETGAKDAYEVKGRGVLHLGVLIEKMRREGFEVAVGKPRVIIKNVDGKWCEPYERATVECPTEHSGRVIEYLGRRRGRMTQMEPLGASSKLEFEIPARGLIGARTALLTLTQGEAILSHVFDSWQKDGGRIPRRNTGVLVADRGGSTVPYALFILADRGKFFVGPGVEVYEGMIVGENGKDEDLALNVCRTKKLTNLRASGRDENVSIAPPVVMGLEEALEYIEDDELLEVTPSHLRIRKIILSDKDRRRTQRSKDKVAT